MTWTFNDLPFNEIPDSFDAIGFIYLITNKLSGKKYIGKKNLYAAQTRQKTVTLKSGIKKKKKIRSKVESDWMKYYGSSEDLKKDVESIGTENFDRQIIRFCKSKGELSYYEAKYQFEHDVLLRPDQFYNRWISIKVHTIHLKSVLQCEPEISK